MEENLKTRSLITVNPGVFQPTQATRVGTRLFVRSPEIGETTINHGSSSNNLDPRQKADLLKRAGQAREELFSAETNEDRHRIIVKYFTKQKGEGLKADYLAENQVIQQFVRDSRNGDYTETADLIDSFKTNFVIGEFKVPYNPDLRKRSLELITFDHFSINPELKEIYPSHAVAVTNVDSTFGFLNEGAVSYFRENMVGVDGSAPHAKAYYFVDKFLKRIENYTMPTMRDFITDDSFRNFRNATEEQLLAGIANWLCAHEHFHAERGSIEQAPFYTPTPKFLRLKEGENIDTTTLAGRNLEYGFELKDKKTRGAFEELRVDVLAFLATYNPRSTYHFGYDQDKVARELILAERLVRYAVMNDPNTSDAITSHLLINYLRNYQSETNHEAALSFDKSGKMRIGSDETLKEAFEALAGEINKLETHIAETYDLSTDDGMTAAKEKIHEFMLSYANAHTADDYKPSAEEITRPYFYEDPFYTKVKASRGTAGFKLRAGLDGLRRRWSPL